MSQRDVEGLLGRMVTDENFRRRFYKDPLGTCAGEAVEVTTRELEAVLALDEQQVAKFAQQVDPRIIRAAISGEAHNLKAVADVGGETGVPPKQHRVR